MALQEFEAFDSEAQAKKNVLKAIEAVAAKRLGNTRTVCRKCYVHPAVVDLYMEGTLAQSLKQRLDGQAEAEAAQPQAGGGGGDGAAGGTTGARGGGGGFTTGTRSARRRSDRGEIQNSCHFFG